MTIRDIRRGHHHDSPSILVHWLYWTIIVLLSCVLLWGWGRAHAIEMTNTHPQDKWQFACDTHYCYDAALWLSTNLVTIYIDGDTGKFQECHADNPPSIGVYTCKIIPGQTAYCPKSDGTWKKYHGHHWHRDCVEPYREQP